MEADLVPAQQHAQAVVVASAHDYSGAGDDDHLLALWLSGRTEHTRRAYAADAGRFLVFLHSTGKELRTATLADVQQYVEGLEGAPATKARRISSVKSLLTFGHRTGYLQFNIGSAIQAPKVPNKLAERILAEEGVLRIITAAKPGRDRVLVRLLYLSGVRVSEAVALRWQHVHPRDGGEAQLTIHGKGERTRHVLITKRLASELATLRGDQPDEAHVFLSRTRRPLAPRDARRIVAKVAKAAGLKQPVSPHWLRHCHGSHALDRGAPIHLVQQDLGHASVATTSRYLHARPGDGSARFLPA